MAVSNATSSERHMAVSALSATPQAALSMASTARRNWPGSLEAAAPAVPAAPMAPATAKTASAWARDRASTSDAALLAALQKWGAGGGGVSLHSKRSCHSVLCSQLAWRRLAARQQLQRHQKPGLPKCISEHFNGHIIQECKLINENSPELRVTH